MKSVLFAIALLAFPAAHATPESDIATCVKGFVAIFASTSEVSSSVTQGLRARCLSANFRKNWDKLGEDKGADPLLNAQDFLASWKTSVVATQTGPFSYRVILGTGKEKSCLMMTLDVSNKIDSSEPCR